MKRREFLALLGAAALIDPIEASAQTPGRIYHLGTLHPAVPVTDGSPFGKIVVKALAERGYILGQNLTFDARGAMGDVAKLPSLLAELKARDVDAIIVVAAVLGLISFASAIRSFESRHVRASIAILIALIAFAVVLYDTSVKIGRLEGPRLEALELASSP